MPTRFWPYKTSSINDYYNINIIYLWQKKITYSKKKQKEQNLP